MNLELLIPILDAPELPSTGRRMSAQSWIDEQRTLGNTTALMRKYMKGDHRAELSANMAKMLRIDLQNANRFNDNYCPRIVYTMSDRLEVDRIEADNDPANVWISERQAENRFDALQTNAHEASLIDANAYVLVSYDDAAKRAVLTNEPAYDGTSGMMVMHDSFGNVVIAVKVWIESADNAGDTMRVTAYFTDRVRRYISVNDSAFVPYEPDGVAFETLFINKGAPIGCPVVHFRNRWVVGSFYGLSELEQMIPLQDSLNRTLTSLIMASELTAFQVKVAFGFKPPADLTPGMFITITDGDVGTEVHKPEAYVLETGQVIPYIQAADWLVGQIGRVSDTPMPEGMGGDNASGESLKQREVGLLGKVERYQVRNGNRWEDVVSLAHRIESTFGSAPPDYTTLSCKWVSPELRNDAEVREGAKLLSDMGYEEEALRQLAPLHKWDEKKILELLEQKQAAAVQQIGTFAQTNTTPTFATVRGLSINNEGVA